MYLFCLADDERVKRQNKKFRRCLSVEVLSENYEKNCLPDALKCRSFETDCTEKDVINRLRNSLNKLLTNEKQCIIRYYYQNLTIEEIAKLEDVSKETVKRTIKSAKEKLKKLVE